MNLPLLRHTWRSQRLKLLVACLALAAWGFFLPVIYSQFGETFKQLFESGAVPRQLANFGGGDIFSLSGSIAVGFIHPISLVVTSIFAVGFATSSIAGERQRGTLEVLLSRPVSRRTVYATLLLSTFGFVAILLVAYIAGILVSASTFGVLGEIELSRVPLVWLNGLLMFGSFAALGLAASVSFDRLTPALGITLAILLVSYFFEILGSLWPDAEVLQPYSLFHYLQTKEVLAGDADPFVFAILAAASIAAIVWALVVFPRRDLAAPA